MRITSKRHKFYGGVYRVVARFRQGAVVCGRRMTFSQAQAKRYRHEQLYKTGWFFLDDEPNPVIEIVRES